MNANACISHIVDNQGLYTNMNQNAQKKLQLGSHGWSSIKHKHTKT